MYVDHTSISTGMITSVVGAGAANWLKTVPARGRFSLFRFYGPTQSFFDRQYEPGDFVKA
ncbi:hypothetical protein IF650_01500 [Cellulosimicrobium terreum]|nr:hypothetical protein [Cellulosimicrobium terreum]